MPLGVPGRGNHPRPGVRELHRLNLGNLGHCHPAIVEAVVLPPIETSGWTREQLDDEIEAVRNQYLEVLSS